MTDHLNPTAYAEHLASYIADPSTVRVRTLQAYGRAPSLDQCRKFRAAIERKHRPRNKLVGSVVLLCGHPTTDDNAIMRDNGNHACRICEEKKAQDRLDKAARRARVAVERKEREQQDYARIMEDLEARFADRKATRQRTKADIAARNTPPWQPSELRGALKGDVLADVAHVCGVTVADLVSDNRSPHLVRARAVATMVFRLRGLSYPEIARVMHRKCHTSIIHLHDTFADRAKREPRMWEAVKLVLDT